MTSDRVAMARPGFDTPRIAAVFLGLSVPALGFGKAAFAVCFGLACLVALASPGHADRARWSWALLKGPVGLFAILTFAWWSVSAIVSIDPTGSFEVIARMLALIGLGGWLTLVLAARPDARRLAETVFFIGVGLVIALAATASYLTPGLLPLFVPFAEDWIDPRQVFKAFSAAVAIALPVLLWIGWRRGGPWRLAALLSLIPAALLLWGHGDQMARASIVGILGGAILVGLVFVAARLSLLGRIVVVAIPCIIGLGLIAWVLGALPPVPITGDGPPAISLPILDAHRQVIWSFVLQKIGEAPLLGHGINTINLTEGAASMVPGLNQQYVPGHPHNWVLETASETGVPGFMLFAATLALSVAALASACVGKGADARSAALVIVAVLGIFWTASLGNFSIWASWWQGALLAVLAPPLAALLREVRSS
jgi:O-antigen ligase